MMGHGRTRGSAMLAGGVLLAGALALGPGRAWALQLGQTVPLVQVKDANDRPAAIPDLGRKVVVLFYTDPDVKEQNEPFRDMLKAAQLDRSRYRALGVVNMKDTWKPNFAIRRAVREKIAKFNSLILTDPDHLLKQAWILGDCNDKDVVIIIGKDGRVRYIKMGKMSEPEMQSALQLIREMLSSMPKG